MGEDWYHVNGGKGDERDEEREINNGIRTKYR